MKWIETNKYATKDEYDCKKNELELISKKLFSRMPETDVEDID